MNHKYFIVKTIALLLVALVVTGCGGAEQRKAKYLEKGKAYIEQKNYDKAKVELRNVLQIDPKHAEAYYLVGLIEEEKQDWAKALGNYSKAVELNPEHLMARAKVGRFYLLMGNTDRATEEMDAILSRQPTNHHGKTLKAAIMAKKGDVAGAVREILPVLAEDPSSVEAVFLLSSLYAKQEQQDKAIELITKGIELNPKNVALRVQLINILDSKKVKDAARIAKIMQEIIEVEPENMLHRATLASFYARINQVEKAEKVLRDAIQEAPEDYDRYLLLAEFLATRKSMETAEAELRAAIKSHPKAYRLHFGLAKLFEAMDARDKLAQMYRDIIDADGIGKNGLEARDRLAELLLKQGHRAEAEKLTQEVLKENPKDNDALVNSARLALIKADPDTAITALRQVVRDQPGSVVASSLLASAHMQKKEPQLASEVLLKAVEASPENIQARLAYSQFLAQNKDIDGALKAVGEALKVAPNSMEALLARMDLLKVKQDMKGVQSVISTIKEKHPDKPMGYYRMGHYHASQKRYDEAIREFEQALTRSGAKESFQVLSAIMSTRVAQGKPDLAINRLNEILKASPNHPFAHELVAEVHITKKQYDEAEKSLQTAIKNNPKWNVPYRNLANLYMVRGETRAAAETYQKGLEAIPDDTQLLLHLAEIYERTRDYDKAISTYEHVVSKDQESDMAANNLAVLLADHRNDAASLKRARELAVRFESSPQPVLRDTLGWVYYRSGETDKAVDILKEVVKQAPNIPIFRYHLGMVYHKQGNMSEAKIHLAKAVEAKSEFAGKEEARETLKKIQ